MEDPVITLTRLLDRTEWTEEDKKWLFDYLDRHGDEQLRELLERRFARSLSQAPVLDAATSDRLLENIHRGIGKPSVREAPRKINRWVVSLVAASLFGLLTLGYVNWLSGDNHPKQPTLAKQSAPIQALKGDVGPGGDKAVLTLADGSTIVLDDAKNGSLTPQGSTHLLKGNGNIAYKPTEATPGKQLFNSIATPRGGQYQVVLPDGTHVWLNAASSIRFPTAFAGKERRVELTGEAYFEVTHEEAMPFTVQVNDAEVRVLGTHFNVMAYEEESQLQTTLLEGAVIFKHGTSVQPLKPGEQSNLSKGGALAIHTLDNVQEAIAWKNGFFHFANDDIENVMRQLSRWYDVDVEYRNKRSSERFVADIPRTSNLSDALKALALTGKVDFEIDGQKVVVR